MTQEARIFVANELGVRLEDVELMEGRLSGSDRSLNAPLSEQEGAAIWNGRICWFVTSRCKMKLSSQSLDGDVRRQWIRDALSQLSQREYTIIIERRLKMKPSRLKNWAKLGISKERVRQIEHQALGK